MFGNAVRNSIMDAMAPTSTLVKTSAEDMAARKAANQIPYRKVRSHPHASHGDGFFPTAKAECHCGAHSVVMTKHPVI